MTTDARFEPIVLPALRGVIGTWVYYSCLMSVEDLAKRVRYADEIHKHKRLSEMIQRKLKTGRSTQIAEYIQHQDERFFNSLVVATYGGQPNWHAVASVEGKVDQELARLSDETLASVGFLTFTGRENLFALDGQHRLAGMKKALKDGLKSGPSFDEISVIFVAHEKTVKGLERTRRLFTTLNKTVRPVSKGDIIALDEDDVMALSVRWLIEESKFFGGNNVAFVAINNMPVDNTESLTTIGNLYDVLRILFTDADSTVRKRKDELQRVRPLDDQLQEYFEFANEYFSLLSKNFPELRQFFKTRDTERVVTRYRNRRGGSAVFRPIGLEIFTQIVARLTKEMPLARAVKRASLLPRTLAHPPYRGLMWDSSTHTMQNAHKVTLREILLYMVGSSKMTEAVLTKRYRKELDDPLAELPRPVI